MYIQNILQYLVTYLSDRLKDMRKDETAVIGRVFHKTSYLPVYDNVQRKKERRA